MVKNNKGVTLIELLIVIVVMGIIAAFSIPAVGTIISNTNKDAILNDAIQVEQAARTYCNTISTCDDLKSDTSPGIQWKTIDEFVSGLDESQYELGDAGVDYVVEWVTGTEGTPGWGVTLTKTNQDSGYEFSTGFIPSQSTREDVNTLTP